ncbi:MAG: hypothetical protein Q4E91_13505 [Lachnospiraceae bacterium]|nr:hypothetical protein [Lachnospiraceae bacterium]
MTNLEINKNISDFIGAYCNKWNLSVAKFAERCNIPYMTIKRIVACSVQKIDVYTVIRIAHATHTPLMEILGVDTENLELYKRITYLTDYDKNIISSILDILEKLHISGRENREIPYTDLDYDKTSYLLDSRLVCPDSLDYSKMKKVTFRSTFSEGMTYCGFRLPDNRLNPYYFKGDILLIQNSEPMEGETGAFLWKEDGFTRLIFSKVHQNGRYTELQPLNGLGRTYRIDNENVADLINWLKIGVVAGIIH